MYSEFSKEKYFCTKCRRYYLYNKTVSVFGNKPEYVKDIFPNPKITICPECRTQAERFPADVKKRGKIKDELHSTATKLRG